MCINPLNYNRLFFNVQCHIFIYFIKNMLVCCFKLLFVDLCILLGLFEILTSHAKGKIEFKFVRPIKTELLNIFIGLEGMMNKLFF